MNNWLLGIWSCWPGYVKVGVVGVAAIVSVGWSGRCLSGRRWGCHCCSRRHWSGRAAEAIDSVSIGAISLLLSGLDVSPIEPWVGSVGVYAGAAGVE